MDFEIVDNDGSMIQEEENKDLVIGPGKANVAGNLPQPNNEHFELHKSQNKLL